MDSALAKVMASLSGFASESEREQARARTYDALARKAKAGHVAGGGVYGYVNVRVDGHVERQIHEPEAAVVRRIFADYVQGIGLKQLAATLTRERAPAPVPRRRHRLPGWAPSAIHAMLTRELYRGVLVWGARRKTDVGGRTKVRQWRAEPERIRVDCPPLRIVPEALWQAVQARRTAHATARGTWTRGPAPAPALLAGLARCALCGGGLMRRGRTHGSGTRRVRVMVYGCGAHARNHSCGNAVELPETTMDTAVLESLARALEPDAIEAAVQEAVEQERAVRAGSAERRHALDRSSP
jgi:site-specific DNA recombinase